MCLHGSYGLEDCPFGSYHTYPSGFREISCLYCSRTISVSFVGLIAHVPVRSVRFQDERSGTKGHVPCQIKPRDAIGSSDDVGRNDGAKCFTYVTCLQYKPSFRPIDTMWSYAHMQHNECQRGVPFADALHRPCNARSNPLSPRLNLRDRLSYPALSL